MTLWRKMNATINVYNTYVRPAIWSSAYKVSSKLLDTCLRMKTVVDTAQLEWSAYTVNAQIIKTIFSPRDVHSSIGHEPSIVNIRLFVLRICIFFTHRSKIDTKHWTVGTHFLGFSSSVLFLYLPDYCFDLSLM